MSVGRVLHRRRRAASAGLVVVCVLVATVAHGVAAEAQRPRVGLVLSGGGARGSAHIGVLKVLEELHVPVDVIAGTSMGAIVGGLYASGMSAAEIEAELGRADWRDLFDDRPPRRELPYRRKQDDLTYLTAFELGFRGGRLVLPSGVVTGQKMAFLLRRLVLPMAGVVDFDQLPIPFRAVATDLESGDIVVLSHGDLADAMRASMSVPGVFSPVELEGKVLVDGGPVRNLPVDVALEMGAEVVIAVDVGQPLAMRDKLTSLAGVSGQIVDMMIRRNVQESAARADIVIHPALEGFSSAQFERVAEMVPLGVQAAMEHEDELRQLAVDEESWAAFRGRRTERSRQAIEITSVQVETDTPFDSRVILDRVRTRPGDILDVELLRRDLQRLYELGDFARVDYHLIPAASGFGLIIDAEEKPWGPNYLRFGLSVRADLVGGSEVNLLANLTATRLNALGAEWKTAVQLGDDPAVLTELYQPLHRHGVVFVAPYLEAGRSSIESFKEDRRVALYQIRRVAAGVDMGLQLGRFGEIRAGVFRGAGHARPRIGAVDLPEIEANGAGYRVLASVDQIDDAQFPRNGYFAGFRFEGWREAWGADFDFDSVQANMGVVGSLGNHSVFAEAKAFSALGTELPPWAQFPLGGFLSLSGYAYGQLTGQYGGVLSLLYYYRVLRLPAGIGDGIYLGGSIEAGNAWQSASEVSASDLRKSASVFVGMDTLVGPLYLAYGRAQGGPDAFYFFVGRTF